MIKKPSTETKRTQSSPGRVGDGPKRKVTHQGNLKHTRKRPSGGKR